MKSPFRRKLGIFFIFIAGCAAAFLVNQFLDSQRFARAQNTVDALRAQAATTQDITSAFKIVDQIMEPSVVNIQVSKTVKAPEIRTPDHLMPMPPSGDDNSQNPDSPDAPDSEIRGTGSGVIIDYDDKAHLAYVLTNNHVAGGADKILVTLTDGREIKGGKVVGADPKTDLAVVQIPVDDVITAKWGDSDTLEKGDWILAFGSPFGYSGSMTHGIVSALNRQAGLLGEAGYENFIQVDAPINPGNSGGPLVNLHGEVVGINTAIASSSGSFSGLGFAIPSNQAKAIYTILREKGKVVRGWLGIQIMDVAKNAALVDSLGFKGPDGVIVAAIFPKTPAAQVLKPQDVITQVEGKPAKDVQTLRNTVAGMPPGAEVKMTIWREGKTSDVTIKLGEQPDDLTAFQDNPDAPAAPDDTQINADTIGARLQDLSPDLTSKFKLGDLKSGAVVTRVTPGSPSELAGLNDGDVITKVDASPVANSTQAIAALKTTDLKKGIRLTVTTADGDRLVFIQEN